MIFVSSQAYEYKTDRIFDDYWVKILVNQAINMSQDELLSIMTDDLLEVYAMGIYKD